MHPRCFKNLPSSSGTMNNKSLQDPSTLIGKQVRVYRNLHQDCWSVQHKGLVVAHVNTVKLKNVRFVVQQGGYERFLREGRKNVHAFVAGELVEIDGPGFNGTGTEVVYNPRVSNLFHTTKKCFKGREYYFDGQEIIKQACCVDKTVFISDAE